MKAELAHYLEQELRFLRKGLQRYAAEHPEAAARLQISSSGEGYADVERIVHGAALLNARTACLLNDGNARIVEGFLNVLFPHFLRPLPSMAIIQFQMDSLLGAKPAHPLTRDADTLVAISKTVSENCSYRLIQDIDVLPIRVEKTEMAGPPFQVDISSVSPKHQVSSLRFRVSRINDVDLISDVAFGDKLRLFINEDRDETFELYEFLFRHTKAIAFTLPGQRKPFAEMSPSCLSPVGLPSGEERLLDFDSRSFPGYGLLTELFAYASRFSFIDLKLPSLGACGTANAFDVHIILSEHSNRLESMVDEGWLKPNCCPVINLFRPETGAIVQDFDLSSHEVPLIVEPLRDSQESEPEFYCDRLEIFSVDRAEIFNVETQQATELFPVYSIVPGDPTSRRFDSYWLRREFVATAGGDISGSDVYLQVSPGFSYTPESAKQLQYRVSVTAMNREVPLGGNVRFELVRTTSGMLAKAVRAPCPPIRPNLPSEELWRIVNHLALNQLTLLTRESLRELLSLYNIFETKSGVSASRIIKSILSLETEPIIERVHVKGRPAFVRGTHVLLGIDGSDLPAGKGFLIGAVLASFLAGFQSVNSSVRVTVSQDGAEIGSWFNVGFSPTV